MQLKTSSYRRSRADYSAVIFDTQLVGPSRRRSTYGARSEPTGDTKTKRSRRTLAMPTRCVEALRRLRKIQHHDKEQAGAKWHASNLVFTTTRGTPLDAANVRRAFRRIVGEAQPASAWTLRELRHSFVSLLSDCGVRLEDIADLCGHSGTTVTEQVYRHQLRPILLDGAIAMDRIFDGVRPDA
jgi:integrase